MLRDLKTYLAIEMSLREETCQLTAESKILYSMVWLKLVFIRCFRGKNTLNPSARRVRTFLRWFRPPPPPKKKKTSAGMKQKCKAGQCKEPIIYSISSPLGLCHVQVKKTAYFWVPSALEVSTLLKILPSNTKWIALRKHEWSNKKKLRDRTEKGKCTNKLERRIGLSTLVNPFHTKHEPPLVIGLDNNTAMPSIG